MSERETPALLDRFLPAADVRHRHETLVKAPAEVVQAAARNVDLQAIPLVRGIFWLRSRLMHATQPDTLPKLGLVAMTQQLGWGVLLDEPGRAYVSGAVCQPWQADVHFSPIPPERFAGYAEPNQIKIAWSLETVTLGPALTRLATETRVAATDDESLARFRSYWRTYRMGIIAIRWLVVPAVRRQAEWQAAALC